MFNLLVILLILPISVISACSLKDCSSCPDGVHCIICTGAHILDQYSACTTCTAAIPNCKTCTTYNNCTSCTSIQYAIQNGTCNLCSTYPTLTYCKQCSSYMVCTKCLTNAFFVNQICVDCPNLLQYCITCSKIDQCTRCTSQAIFMPDHTCTACFFFMDACYTCTKTNICTQCDPANQTVTLSANLCYLCSKLMQNCLNCSSSTLCTLCDPGFSLATNGTCVCSLCGLQCMAILHNCNICQNITTCFSCYYGNPVIGGCTTVIGCTSIALNIITLLYECTTCASPEFQLNNQTKLCECVSGHLAGQYCTNMVGCLTITKNSSGQFCLQADTYHHFGIINGVSTCVPLFQLATISSTICTEICGDGYLFNKQCDDGNNLDYDGCSSSCFVQKNYRCLGGSSSTPSICIYQGSVVFTDVEVSKLEDANQALIIFSVSPQMSNLALMDLSKYFEIKIAGNISISYISVINGQIHLILDYFHSIEGLTANATLTFNYSLIKSPKTQIMFALDSSNQALVFFKNPKINKFFQKLCLSLSLGVCSIFVVASYAHKMIGVETILVFQLIFICYLFDSMNDGEVLYLKMFSYSFGQSSTFKNSHPALKRPIFTKLNLQTNLIENGQIIALVQIIILVIYFLKQLVSKFINVPMIFQKYLKSKSINKNVKNGMKICQILYTNFNDYLVFPYFIGFLFVQYFSVIGLCLLSANPKQTTFHKMKVSIQLILLFFSHIIYFSEWKIWAIKSEEIRKKLMNQITKMNYIPLFLTYLLCIIVFVTSNLIIGNKNYFYMGLSILVMVSLVSFIFYRPYKHNFHNFANIYNYLTITVCITFFLLLSQNIILEEKDKIILIYAIMFLLAGVLIIALIRIILQFKNKWDKLPKININNEEQKIVKILSKQMRDQVISDQERLVSQLNNLNPYRIMNQQLKSKVQQHNHLNKDRMSKNMPLLDETLELAHLKKLYLID